jgi:hypothetical protein
MGFSENEKAHARPFSPVWVFSMSRYRAGGLLLEKEKVRASERET